MARGRIALGVGIVAVLAVVTAFVVRSTFFDEPAVVASEPVAASASPSPDTTEDPDPMPELHNTGDDFDRIIRSIDGFRHWLYRNPDPGLVDRIYHEDCPCHAEMAERLQQLRDAGYRVSQGGALIHSVEMLDRDDTAVALKVVDTSLPTVVVDTRTGDVIDSDDRGPDSAFRVLLLQQGGRWLVRDIRAAALDLAPVNTP